MSTKEHAIGLATVEEYTACRTRLAALQTEAIKTWDRLARIGSLLSTSPQCSADSIVDVVAMIDQETQNFPTVDYVRNLALRIKTELERKQQICAALQKMGVEPEE